MTADSVPAPMVQVPAALVDALDEWDVRYPAKWAFGASANYEMGVRDERRRLREIIVMGRNTFAVDAATPAASVPAADILALAEKWEDGGRDKAPVRFFVADLRELLVAAAEQADKGEGGQRGGKSQDTATPHDPSLTAPAAPVGEPLCTHPFPAKYPDGLHHCRDCGLTWDDPPARVPVNDEAECQERCCVQRRALKNIGQLFMDAVRAARLAGKDDQR